jgi:DNA end-binding protein Ku
MMATVQHHFFKFLVLIYDMRSIWKGSISFGLVSIPISMFSAVEDKRVSFKLLDKDHHEPIEYKKWCPSCKKEVAWEDIHKGLEVTKGEYMVFTQEELSALKPEKSDTIDVIEFIDSNQIDPIFYNKHYYLAPQKPKDKAYFLFKEVLESSAKTAIARFTMREKEYVAAISSYKEGILLSTLSYGYEVRDINSLEVLQTRPKVTKEESELAKQIINNLYKDEFRIDKFRDTYSDMIREMAEKGEKTITTIEPRREEGEKSLVEALKATLEQNSKPKKRKKG